MSIIPPKASGIYKITCIPASKIYIGSAINIRKRWNEHRAALRANRHQNVYLQRAWNAYGQDAFQFEIIELVMFPEYLLEREQYYLDTLRPFEADTGFNMVRKAGSTEGKKHSVETRKKISERLRQRAQPCSEERRRELSEQLKGRKFTEEHRRKLSEALRRRVRSPESAQKTAETKRARGTDKMSAEARKKISEAGKRRKVSAETREKMRQTALKRPPVSEETRKKISEKARNRSEQSRQRMSEGQRRRDPATFFPLAEAMRGRALTEEQRQKGAETRRKNAKPRHIVTDLATGEEMIVCLWVFCAEHGLSYQSMQSIVSGNQKAHKGYTVRRL